MEIVCLCTAATILQEDIDAIIDRVGLIISADLHADTAATKCFALVMISKCSLTYANTLVTENAGAAGGPGSLNIVVVSNYNVSTGALLLSPVDDLGMFVIKGVHKRIRALFS